MRVIPGETIRFKSWTGATVTMLVKSKSDPSIVPEGLRIITGTTPDGREVSCYDDQVLPTSVIKKG